MIPKIAYIVAKKFDKRAKFLVRVGVVSLVAFLLAAMVNFAALDNMLAITMFPLGVVFLVCGAGILTHWFKDKDNYETPNFQAFWHSTTPLGRAYLWLATPLITIWFIGVIAIMLGSIVHTVAFLSV